MQRLLTRRFGHDGYEPTREAAMTVFAKSPLVSNPAA
jgi:hypothetical protein